MSNQNNTDFIHVDDWVPDDKSAIVRGNGKLIYVPFDKLFNNPKLATINNFIINKQSYIKHIEMLTNYINYFIKYYDESQELILAYLKLKSIIDTKKRNTIKLNSFITLMYSILFTPTIIEHIKQMVEDNFDLNLTVEGVKNYNEDYEFTTEHAKIMMQISISMKLMIPVMFHFLNVSKYIKDNGSISICYERLFDIYGTDEGINIRNKLYNWMYSRIQHNGTRNSKIWDQHEIFGTNILTKLDEMLNNQIISESMFKYIFRKNFIKLNYVTVNKQLMYFIAYKYESNRIELNSSKDPITGLSGIDKIEMNSSKMDESVMILSDLNIKQTIKRLKKKFKVKISDQEIDYYMNNSIITKFQSKLIFYFFAKYFDGFRDLNVLGRRNYIKLMIIMKHILTERGFIYLPQIISGNIESKLNTRTIQNAKFLNKIKSSSLYSTLISEKYELLESLEKHSIIMNILSTLINTTFSSVEYDSPESLGDRIDINSDILADEFLNYITQL